MLRVHITRVPRRIVDPFRVNLLHTQVGIVEEMKRIAEPGRRSSPVKIAFRSVMRKDDIVGPLLFEVLGNPARPQVRRENAIAQAAEVDQIDMTEISDSSYIEYADLCARWIM